MPHTSARRPRALATALAAAGVTGALADSVAAEAFPAPGTGLDLETPTPAAAEADPAEASESNGEEPTAHRGPVLGLAAALGAVWFAQQASDTSGGTPDHGDDPPDGDDPHPIFPRPEPDDPAVGVAPPHLEQTGAESAHAAGITGESAEIAVLDSDFRTTHRELDAERTTYARHYDPGDRDVPEQEAQVHGTHVASLAGGRDVGIAPQAELELHADGPNTGAWSIDASAADWRRSTRRTRMC